MPQGDQGRFRDALASRDFRVLIGAFTLDQIGTWAYNVVLLVYVYERTGSATWVAVTSAVRWLPGLLLGPYAGLLGDRYEKTLVLRVSGLLSGLAMLGLAAVVATDGPLLLLLALAFLCALLLTPYPTAAMALRPEVVQEKDLAAANALFTTVDSLVIVLGPLLGAVLLAVDERSTTFLLNAVTFFVASVWISTVKVRSTVGTDRDQSFRKQIAHGVSALRSEPVAMVLVLFVALDSAVYGATTVLYLPMAERFGSGSDSYGVLVASFALGGVLVAGVVNKLSSLARLAPVVLGGMLLMGLPFAATVLTESLLVGAALQGLVGAGMVAVDVLAITALQRDLPREVLSRVLGILTTLAVGGMLLASLLMAPLLAGAGLEAALLVLAAVVVVGSVVGVRPLVVADRRGAETHALLAPRVALLEALDLLSSAPRATLERLAGAVEVVELDARSVVVRQGEPADALWVVVTGAVEVLTTDAWGTERVHSGLGAHSYVGEIGLLRGIPRTATVRTTAPSTLWRIPAADVLEALSGASASTSLLAVSGARLAQLQPWVATVPALRPWEQEPVRVLDLTASEAVPPAAAEEAPGVSGPTARQP
jgi:CRP-like cAMP-binding protein